jgi:hypothetical protein
MEKEASAFKQEWEAKKLLKQAKKKARKQLQKQGHSHGEASHLVKSALKNMVADNRPERKAAGRGG